MTLQKIILLTGATDGIGLETARTLVEQGHYVLLHGRNPRKLAEVEKTLAALPGNGRVTGYLADLSRLDEVECMAEKIIAAHTRLDVLINNAGVFKTPEPITREGLDVRFVVNTLAPYLLTQRLMPLLGNDARVVNLSSAAQSPVNLQALAGKVRLTDDFAAYAQSKLAITQWSRALAQSLKDNGTMVVAVNPGSLLATKMVKEGFGMAGNDVRIGVDILMRAALSAEFAQATGLYFDNDSGKFSAPHPDALDTQKTAAVVDAIETAIMSVSPV